MNQKERLRGKGSSFGLSESIHHGKRRGIDEYQERVERGREEKGGGLLLPIHMPRQEVGHRKGATHKRTRVPKLLVGYHNLGALIALRHPKGS